MNGFTVDPVALRRHASEVRRVATGVTQAGGAANEVGIGGVDIYGLLCSGLIVPALHGFFGDAVALVTKAGEFADAYADGLENNCDEYDEIDRQVRDTLTTLHSKIV